MAEHAHFIEATGFRVHFCDPNSPWKRDTNKNTNVPPRQFFPKGTKIAGVTNEGVDKVQDLLNGRPWGRGRRRRRWRRPAKWSPDSVSD